MNGKYPRLSALAEAAIIYGVYALSGILIGVIFGKIDRGHGFTSNVWYSVHAGFIELAHHGQPLLYGPYWNGPGTYHLSWVNLEWGWQIILAVMAGPNFQHGWVIWLFMIMCGVLYAAIAAWALRTTSPGLNLSMYGPLITTGMFFLGPEWTTRPQVLTASFWLLLLILLYRGRSNWKYLLPIVPLTLVWSQIHGDWILAPVLTLLESGIYLLQRKWKWASVSAGLAALLIVDVILFTPEHWTTITYTFWLEGNPWLHTFISEWQSPVFSSPPSLFILGIIVLALTFGLWFGVRERNWTLWLWWVGTLVEYLIHRRMALYLAGTTILVLGDVVTHSKWFNSGSLRIEERAKKWLWLPVAIMVMSLGLFSGFSSQLPNWSTYFNVVRPTGLIAWLQTHPDHRGLQYSNIGNGMLEYYGQHNMFFDGRDDFFLWHDHRFQHEAYSLSGYDWPYMVKHYHITRVIVMKDAAISRFHIQLMRHVLSHTLRWKEVYSGTQATVWQPPNHPK